MIRLPAEWETQSAVMLAWPHQNTDWQNNLVETQATYLNIIDHLLLYTDVLLAVDPNQYDNVHSKLQRQFERRSHQLRCIPVAYNDTWTRDYGPITVERNQRATLLDFEFNGWGNKFPSDLDNALTAAAYCENAFGHLSLDRQDMVLEGGAIESDGQGCLMTTRRCLLNQNRNPDLKRTVIEQMLRETLGVKKILWLEHGYLAGDDTDGHIDTLARFAPNGVITYVRCDDKNDEHYQEFIRMEQEILGFADVSDKPFHPIALPWPEPKYSDTGERLPATYANYLITNNAVLVPTYSDPHDREAIITVQSAFPGRNVHGIDCSALIKQHGSLHCVTMQLPKMVFKKT